MSQTRVHWNNLDAWHSLVRCVFVKELSTKVAAVILGKTPLTFTTRRDRVQAITISWVPVAAGGKINSLGLWKFELIGSWPTKLVNSIYIQYFKLSSRTG